MIKLQRWSIQGGDFEHDPEYVGEYQDDNGEWVRASEALAVIETLLASLGNPDGHTHQCRTCLLYYTPQPRQSEDCPAGCNDWPPPQ